MEETERAEPSFLKDLLAAVMIIAGFVAAMPLPVVRLPGYLLMVAFDALERTFPVLSQNYGVALAAYLIGLALLTAVLSQPLRDRIDMTPWWYAPVAIALVVGGLVVLGVVTLVYLPGGADPVSLGVAILTAGALFAIAWVTIRGGKKRYAAVQELEQQMARQGTGTVGAEPTDETDTGAEADSDADTDEDTGRA